MLIVLLRQGAAENESRVTATEHHLAQSGHRQMKRVARALRRLIPAVNEIYSSPADDAHDAAECIANYCAHGAEVITAKALSSSADIDDFWRLLRSSNAECACFVADEPQLTRALRATTSLPADGLELQTGGCYGVEFDRSAAHGRLLWMLSPQLLS